ncbi:acid phosphatase-domain-containing protein [Russula earlei]|uniref:Acid phosphatase-domain-containing protein n=1 Tax=Russula earlei TaxID=71964 RepID=A0ACC0UD89_9AGAM|nr:acid phosphatase-domain-containing protein [Russula earlei]
MSYSNVIALATDWTIWHGILESRTWGKGVGALALVQDNITRVTDQLLQDGTNPNNQIRVYDGISMVVHDILRNGTKLAIVSANPSKDMCDRALFYFKTINPSNNQQSSIIDLVEYDEVQDSNPEIKGVNPFRNIRRLSGSDYSQMLMFDAEAASNTVRITLGVSFELVRDRGSGLTWALYQRGLQAWRRAISITLLPNPPTRRRRVLIGYSGLGPTWIRRVRVGEGVVERTEAYRWGYAFYVAASSRTARVFRDLLRSGGQRRARVCQVWVKDYDSWVNVNKIWVPEHGSTVTRTDNKHWSHEQSAQSQEDRDRSIEDHWGVPTPYVLFSRHHHVRGMRKRGRWSEMVVYTQIQRALFDIRPLTDAQVRRISKPSPYPFHRQFRRWNIVVPDETRREFLRHKEKKLYRLSAKAPRPGQTPLPRRRRPKKRLRILVQGRGGATRVFWQAKNGSIRTKGWRPNGSPWPTRILVRARRTRRYTPLAVINWGGKFGFRYIRLFYVDNKNILRNMKGRKGSWRAGKLGRLKLAVAPRSKRLSVRRRGRKQRVRFKSARGRIRVAVFGKKGWKVT